MSKLNRMCIFDKNESGFSLKWENKPFGDKTMENLTAKHATIEQHIRNTMNLFTTLISRIKMLARYNQSMNWIYHLNVVWIIQFNDHCVQFDRHSLSTNEWVLFFSTDLTIAQPFNNWKIFFEMICIDSVSRRHFF